MRLSIIWSLAFACSVAGCAADGAVLDAATGTTSDELELAGETLAVSDELSFAATDAMTAGAKFVPPQCTMVFGSEHHVNVGQGVKLHVLAKHSVRALATYPRRAILMLPPTLATNAMYDAAVPGDGSFNALERAAREGYFAYSLSYEGYGQSTHPANGSTVTAERMLQQAGQVVEWIRQNSLADKVDVFGMSIGSSIAAALGGTQSPIQRSHVGKVVLTSNVYKSVTPFFEQVFFTPEFRAFLESAPNGYIMTEPAAYAPLMSEVVPSAFAWASVKLSGVYATGPTLEGFDLPVFDATRGRAPALQFWGDADPVTPLSDVAAMQADYGGSIRLHVIPNGAHTLHLEAGREELWRETFKFLNEGRGPVQQLGCPN